MSPALLLAGLILGIDSTTPLPDANHAPFVFDPSGAIYSLGQGPIADTTYIRKLSPSGTLVYLTPLPFRAGTIRADAAGNAYVVALDSPTVLKLDPTGARIVYRIQLGERTSITGLDVDASGNAYVSGAAFGGELPTTPAAFQPSAVSGRLHPFLAKLSPSGSILYATYLTGSTSGSSNVLFGQANRIIADATGAAIVLGSTNATDFPTTPGVLRPTPPAVPAGQSPAFLARIDPSGSRLIYSTYLDLYSYLVDVAQLHATPAGAAWLISPKPNARSMQILRIHPQGTSIDVSRAIPRDLYGLLAAVNSEGGLYLAGRLQYFGNLPLRNNLFPCPDDLAGFLIALDSSGDLRLSTYLPPSHYPAALAVGQQESVSIVTHRIGSLDLLRLSPRDSHTPIPMACMANAASLYKGPVAAGEIVTIFGEALPEAPSVNINGKPAPILYASESQINAIVPWSLTGSTAEVCVLRGNVKLSCLDRPVAESEPGVFVTDDDYAIAWNQDGTRNSAQHPAQPYSLVSVLATGLGPITPTPADGEILNPPLPALRLQPLLSYSGGITIGSFFQFAAYRASPVPGAVAGIFQVYFHAASQTLSLTMVEGRRFTRSFRIHVKQ